MPLTAGALVCGAGIGQPHRTQIPLHAGGAGSRGPVSRGQGRSTRAEISATRHGAVRAWR
jgi:hypothetical protein